MVASEQRVVVTGASGHIGYHVARALRDAGFSVDILIRRVNVNVVDLVRRGVRHHFVDLAEPAGYRRVLRDAACLFHLAGENTTAQDNPEGVLASTVGLTRTVLTVAAEEGVKT